MISPISRTPGPDDNMRKPPVKTAFLNLFAKHWNTFELQQRHRRSGVTININELLVTQNSRIWQIAQESEPVVPIRHAHSLLRRAVRMPGQRIIKVSKYRPLRPQPSDQASSETRRSRPCRTEARHERCEVGTRQANLFRIPQSARANMLKNVARIRVARLQVVLTGLNVTSAGRRVDDDTQAGKAQLNLSQAEWLCHWPDPPPGADLHLRRACHAPLGVKFLPERLLQSAF